MARKVKKLPEQVLVRWGGTPDEPYLECTETNAGIEDGERVGVYQLVGVKQQRVTEELV